MPSILPESEKKKWGTELGTCQGAFISNVNTCTNSEYRELHSKIFS